MFSIGTYVFLLITRPFRIGIADFKLKTLKMRKFSKKTASDSPSPWGEGRDEGGREISTNHVARINLAKSLSNDLMGIGHQMKILISEVIIFCGLFAAFDFASAQTWTPTTAPSSDWLSVASSADGSKLIASAGDGFIFTSIDSGTSWTQTSAPSNTWISVACSADGNKLVAALYEGGIYTSTNSGTDWTETSATSNVWCSVVSSADGMKLTAAALQDLSGNMGRIYTSTNSGVTWTLTAAPAEPWNSIACSANGNQLVAVTPQDHFGNGSLVPGCGLIYISTNSGLSWSSNSAPNENWWSVASSSDGSKLVAITLHIPTSIPGSIYTSINSGVSWTQENVTNELWYCVASSADGNKLAAAVWYGPDSIYTSMDSGVNWKTNNAPDEYWRSIASSADGYKLVAAAQDGQIWISQTTPTPQLSLASSNGNLAFSWLVPSTNFVLQQNLDLGTTNWVTLTNIPTLNLTNLRNQLVLSSSNNCGFFRLITQ